MLLILIGLLLIALAAFGSARDWELFYEVLGPFLILVATILVVLGIFLPMGGFYEPVVVETQVLYPLETKDENAIEMSNTYLVIDLFVPGNTGILSEYRYSVSEGEEETIDSSSTRAVIGEIDVPVIEKCKMKPKISIWSFALSGKKEVNIIRVSQDQVKYIPGK